MYIILFDESGTYADGYSGCRYSLRQGRKLLEETRNGDVPPIIRAERWEFGNWVLWNGTDISKFSWKLRR